MLWITENIPTSFRVVVARPQESSISRPHGNWISSASPLCLDPVYTYMELFVCTKRAIIDINSPYNFNEMYPPESKLGCKVGSDTF